MSKKQTDTNESCRLNRVGGQAVLEGVMMKAGSRTVTTCRKENGTLVVYDDTFTSVRKKHKILNLPIIRGVVNFIEMMALSVKTLNASADALGIEEEEGKAEKWMRKHLGIGLTDLIMVLGVVLGFALALFLFMFLPMWAADGINYLYKLASGNEEGISATVIAVIEGVMKVVIFLAYLWLVSLIPDIKRTFMYHGAEHKSIACFEAGEDLTPQNAAKHKRFHPRCGTSFMFLMILLGIFAGMFVRNVFPGLPTIAYTGIRILILPIIMGVGYELLMIMGKHDNAVTRIISAPGLWVQRLTTKEPTEDMLEVAIVSIKCALRDDFSEFEEYFAARPWEADGGETIIASEKKASSKSKKSDDNTEECKESEVGVFDGEGISKAAAEDGGVTAESTDTVAESTVDENTADGNTAEAIGISTDGNADEVENDA